MFYTPFKSNIFYSFQNEDYRTELEVIRVLKRQNIKVLTIASSGENSLSILADNNVSYVVGVDTNDAQCKLCELRQIALTYLSHQEHCLLFGYTPTSTPLCDPDERIMLYEKIADYLQPDTRGYWDSRKELDIAFGLAFTGRNDQIAVHIQERLSHEGIYPFTTAIELVHFDTFKKVFTETFTTEFIKNMFDIAGDVAAERISSQAETIAGYYFNALKKQKPELNYFLTTFFQNRYSHIAGTQGVPEYLIPDTYQLLQHKVQNHKPEWIHGNILDVINKLAASTTFDLISISNIADWMTELDYERTLQNALRSLSNGGAFLARKATGGFPLSDIAKKYLVIDEDITQDLKSIERGPMWSDIMVGFKR